MQHPHTPASPPTAPPELRGEGRVLLVSCYELGHQPLGITSPAGLLRANGFAPALHDLAVERLDPEQVRSAAFVGVSVPMHTALVMGLAAARRVRELNPAAHVCFYGLYAALNADYLLDGPADAVIGGEYEPPLLEWLQALETGSATPPEGVSLPGRPQPPRLRRSPFAVPERGGTAPLESYARLVTEGGEHTAGYVEATKGCKHTCLHCPITPVYGGRFFAVPRDVVLADIEQQVEAGARHITFGDPDFLNGPGHARALVRALHERFPHVTYDFTTKVEHILKHRDLFGLFAETGCLFVISAVESLSETVLQALDKGHTAEEVREALEIMRGAGITLRPTFVPFTPWTSLQDYLELLAFVNAEGLVHHLEPVQFSIRLLVPPGSALQDSPQFAPYQGPLDPEAFTYRWRHPDPRMDALQERVADIVARAADRGEPAEETFRTVLVEALHTAGQAERLPSLLSAGARSRPAPRLTEPWFC